MIDCTVISCLYGESHDRFVADWADGVGRLSPAPAAVIVGTDRRHRTIHGAQIRVGDCHWNYPQAFYLQTALDFVETEWVWIHDIDDVALPNALDGIDKVTADVWQLGYQRSDGEVYTPPQLAAEEVLTADRNLFVAGSCVRTSKLREVGGFPDCALQDWALWRRLALANATFESSDRIHFNYRRHEDARGEAELTLDRRDGDVREMLDLERDLAYTG